MLNALTHVWRFASAHPVTRDRPLGALARFVGYQLRIRLTGRVVHPWIANASLLMRPSMRGATGNIYYGVDELPEMGFLLHFLRQGDLFFDVGANVGTYTVLASAVCGATTVAFEPDPNTASRLRDNVALNGLAGLVTVEQAAVSASSGTTKLSIGLDAINHIVGAEESGQEVRMVALDDGPWETPTLMKIDVEGFEEQVIAGAGRRLADPRLAALLIENPTPAIEATLAEFGFSRRHYDPRTRALTATPHDMYERNGLFVRDEARCRATLASAPRFSVLGRSY
jgi:FkbM family methyltransferase